MRWICLYASFCVICCLRQIGVSPPQFQYGFEYILDQIPNGIRAGLLIVTPVLAFWLLLHQFRAYLPFGGLQKMEIVLTDVALTAFNWICAERQ